jgi:hypothetical protein
MIGGSTRHDQRKRDTSRADAVHVTIPLIFRHDRRAMLGAALSGLTRLGTRLAAR